MEKYFEKDNWERSSHQAAANLLMRYTAIDQKGLEVSCNSEEIGENFIDCTYNTWLVTPHLCMHFLICLKVIEISTR